MKHKALALRIVLIVGIAAAIAVVHAQSNEFSTNYEEFVEQMDEVFSVTQDKKKAKTFIADVKSFMLSATVDDVYKQKYIATCQRLKKLKARPYPHYENCFLAFKQLANKSCNIRGENYIAWCEALDAASHSRTAPLNATNNFLLAGMEYMNDRTICRVPSCRWRINTNEARFSFDGEQLIIDVPTTRLVCLAQSDSIEILNTAGRYYHNDKRWESDGALVTWERCNLSPKDVYANLNHYTIDMSKSSFEADSVEFLNTNYFSEPLFGRLEHKVVNTKSTLGNKYPKFYTASEQRMEIKDIFKNIDYEGGFTQLGSSFRGSGTAENPAVVNIYRNDTLFVHVTSQSFLLFPDRIQCAEGKTTIKLDDAEITHPGLQFSYHDKNRTMRLVRNGDGTEQSLYFDTYHCVSMDIEMIQWYVDEPYMRLGMIEGAARGLSIFESNNYYREEYYYQLQGMAWEHPFQTLVDFYRYYGGQPFTAEDYANYRRIAVSEIRQEIMNMAYEGFLDYDTNTDLVQPRQRMLDYLQYRLGNKDYDVIRFQSTTQSGQPNAILNLQNYDIYLNGVTGIALSDNQNVGIYPLDGQIILKRNRDFKFDGLIEAGMLSLTGRGFYFSYDDFGIDMSTIDEMQMRVVTDQIGPQGQEVIALVGNTLSDLAGHLQIDEPDNKSGRKKNPQYPRFTSTKESYVYYDAPNIQDGKYKRDRFYFAVDPFEFENINDIRFHNTKFTGRFISNIFPEFEETLVIRKHDNSLGFVRDTPTEGYPIYDGKATFINTIDLSNRGLHGSGDLIYLASTSKSKDFLFLPDETTGLTYDFDIEFTMMPPTYPGVELGHNQQVAEMDGSYVNGQTSIRFVPDENRLTSKNTKGDFYMFPNSELRNGFECTMGGALTITPSGMAGTGRIDFMQASLESEAMTFTDHNILADTAFFTTYKYINNELTTMTGALRREIVHNFDKYAAKLYSTTAADIPRQRYENQPLHENAVIRRLTTEDADINALLYNSCMVANIDFNAREGYFRNKSGVGIEWEATTIKYKTRLQQFTWDMDKNQQILGMTGSQGNRFVCTKEKRDSLNFMVPVAIYDFDANTLLCKEVKFINTADAHVLLDSLCQFYIHENAIMDALPRSVVELRTDSTYHRIYDATITIEGAKKYKGIGTYDFYDKQGRRHELFVSEITQDEEATTTASATISQDMPLDEHFTFRGRANIRTTRELLEFDGGARMVHKSHYGPTGYVKFVSVVNPQRVIIPIDKERINNWKDDEIHRNFFMRKDSVHVYSSFIESRKDHSDVPLVTAYGELFYNKIFDRFDITTHEKRLNPDTCGTLLSFIPEEETMTATGELDLGIMSVCKGKLVDMMSAGTIKHQRDGNKITVHNALMFMDFFISDELATMMYKDILASSAQPCDSLGQRYLQRCREVLDTMQYHDMLEFRSLPPFDKETGLLPSGDGSWLFTFDDISMLWNTPKRAYICDTTVNLMMIRERSVHRRVHMKAEYVCRKSGSSFNILLTAGDCWYYFGFKGQYMRILSSNKDFNTALQKTEQKDRRQRIDGVVYQFALAPDSQRKNFLKQFGPLPETAVQQDDDEPEEEQIPDDDYDDEPDENQ